MKNIYSLVFLVLFSTIANAQITVLKTSQNLLKEYQNEEIWQKASKETTVSLMAQPMVAPRPQKTSVPNLHVTALHDGKNIAFRLRWADPQKNDATRLNTFSDAVAMEFPVLNNEQPPAVIMGHTGSPVHLFHWRYQYQLDALQKSLRTVHQIYPNMSIDMYPQDFKVKGNYPQATEESKESFSGGRAVGNPQSYLKPNGIDELIAEGFGTATTKEKVEARAHGVWKDGEWIVYILRPLQCTDGSSLQPGGKSHVAFAVWQGENHEVGGLKSLTMMWTPFEIKEN